MTAKLRETEEEQSQLSRLNRFKAVIIRVQFPNRYVLQGKFTPYETIEAVMDFVQPHLLESAGEFYLCKNSGISFAYILVWPCCFGWPCWSRLSILTYSHFASRHHSTKDCNRQRIALIRGELRSVGDFAFWLRQKAVQLPQRGDFGQSVIGKGSSCQSIRRQVILISIAANSGNLKRFHFSPHELHLRHSLSYKDPVHSQSDDACGAAGSSAESTAARPKPQMHQPSTSHSSEKLPKWFKSFAKWPLVDQ